MRSLGATEKTKERPSLVSVDKTALDANEEEIVCNNSSETSESVQAE